LFETVFCFLAVFLAVSIRIWDKPAFAEFGSAAIFGKWYFFPAVLKKIEPGMNIFIGTGAAEPRTLVNCLRHAWGYGLQDLNLHMF